MIQFAPALPALAESPNASGYGYADSAVPETSQFEYYRGEWRAEMKVRQDDGSFAKSDFVANIKGRYLPDHKTFQTEFASPSGFFSTDLRAYKLSTGRWEALFLNANSQRWHHFTAQIVDGKMTTVVVGGYSGHEPFDVKIIDTRISADHYIKQVYQSTDKMQTWTLRYEMDVRRELPTASPNR